MKRETNFRLILNRAAIFEAKFTLMHQASKSIPFKSNVYEVNELQENNILRNQEIKNFI